MKKKMKSTDLSFFKIVHQNLLEQCPPSIDSHQWEQFRINYKKASNYEELPNPVQLDIELNGGCNMKCPF